jgi:hypothetical protein
MASFEKIKSATETLTIEAPAKEAAMQVVTSKSDWDENHMSIFDTVAKQGCPVKFIKWDGMQIAQLHTCALLKDFETNLRVGRYSTNSPGTDLSEPNAYACR